MKLAIIWGYILIWFGPRTATTLKGVYYRLLAQGRSADKKGSCMYRAPDGKKCAIGWLLPNKDYYPQLEGKEIENLPDNLVRKITNKLHVDEYTLRKVQAMHDNAFHSGSLKLWREHFNSKWREQGLPT